MAVVLLAGCGEKPAEAPKSSGAGNPVTAPVDYLGAVARAKKTMEKTIDGVALTQTIQLFYAQEGRYPTALNELVTRGYLSSLPNPPAGMRFDYAPQTGELRVVRQ